MSSSRASGRSTVKTPSSSSPRSSPGKTPRPSSIGPCGFRRRSCGSDRARAAAWPPLSRSLLRRDPRIDALLEHVERQGAGAEDLVVVLADIETVAERFAGPLAQLRDLQ